MSNMERVSTQGILRREVSHSGDMPTSYRASIEFFVFVENGVYIAYCPSLDLSTSAETYNEAISSFYEMFQLHLQWCWDHDTLLEDLTSHGWQVKKQTLVPPKISMLMRKPEMKKLMDGQIGFEKIVSPVRIPAMA